MGSGPTIGGASRPDGSGVNAAYERQMTEQHLPNIQRDQEASLARYQQLMGAMPKASKMTGRSANNALDFLRQRNASLQGMAGYTDEGGLAGYKQADAAAAALAQPTQGYMQSQAETESDRAKRVRELLETEFGNLSEQDRINYAYENAAMNLINSTKAKKLGIQTYAAQQAMKDASSASQFMAGLGSKIDWSKIFGNGKAPGSNVESSPYGGLG